MTTAASPQREADARINAVVVRIRACDLGGLVRPYGFDKAVVDLDLLERLAALAELAPRPQPVRTRLMSMREAAECACHHTCAENPPTRCSLSGDWHVHPGDPCPVHPDAPGDR